MNPLLQLLSFRGHGPLLQFVSGFGKAVFYLRLGFGYTLGSGFEGVEVAHAGVLDVFGVAGD
jgi:hypothetical protein